MTFIRNAAEAGEQFAHAAPLLQKVVDEAVHGEFDVSDIRAMVDAERAVVALVWDDGQPLWALAFEFLHYPRMLAVNIMAAGGKDVERACGEFMPAFRAYCKAAGAARVQASGSAAMARLLGRVGFSGLYQVVAMDLQGV